MITKINYKNNYLNKKPYKLFSMNKNKNKKINSQVNINNHIEIM